MRVLVAYASRHGATQGIAERIAATLQAAGLETECRPAAAVKDLAGYDACVIGSAAYMFRWLGEATKLVERGRSILATRPVWLFSSGPLGTEPTNDAGQDQKVAAIPKGIEELGTSVHAREHRVFFGAYAHGRKPIGIAERLMAVMPAAKEGLPEGDFRDWPEIESWARSIAEQLARVPAG